MFKLQVMASLSGGVLSVLVAIAVLGCGTAQFQTCYDNATASCGGNVVTGVSNASDCCLGDGFWFRVSQGQCVQCIVHGFERTAVSVDEAQEETLVVRMDIKGNTLDEAQFRVTDIDLNLRCQDVTTESTDYSTRACITPINLDRERPAQLTSEVLITFPTDRIALEGTEVLELRLEPTTLTQTDVNTAGNIFFQDTSIRINDTTDLGLGFEQEDYEGNEGPDRLSTLRNMPCTVTIRLDRTTIEEDLTFQLIPRTIAENVDASGPPPTATLRGANASRIDFNDAQPFEVTMRAGTESVIATIPIVDDEINEAEEEFVVVLDVNRTFTNPVTFTTQTTVCRIPRSDPIEIGFREATVEHNESASQATFTAILEKDRQSEQTFVVRIQISTPRVQGVGEPATAFPTQPADFSLGTAAAFNVTLTPADNGTELAYQILDDNIPENTEIFQLSSDPDPNTPNNPDFLCDDDPSFQFNGRDCFSDLLVVILDDDVVVIGFVETQLEVDEGDGQATLNVSISFPAPDPLLGFEIMFRLDATMMNITAGPRPASASRFDRVVPGLHDYQEVAPGSVLPRDFEGNRRLQTFSVVIYDDDVPEGVEELNITLSLQDPSLANRVTVSPAVATVRIDDGARCYDDAAADCRGNEVPFVSTGDCCLGNGSWFSSETGGCFQCIFITVGYVQTAVTVPESAGVAQLTVAISVPPQADPIDTSFFLLVNTNDGTAAAAADYTLANFSLGPFNNTVRQLSFNVSITDDTIPEEDEVFTASLTLSPGDQATFVIVAPDSANFTILDEDGIVVGFERTTYTINEMDGQVELCVNVTVPADQNIDDVTFSLMVDTQNGTAMGSGTVGSGMIGSGVDYDYMSVMTTLTTFAMEQPRQCFNVTVNDDMEVEMDEAFFANLSLIPVSVTNIDPNQITVAPAQATVIIMDDDLLPDTATTRPPLPTSRIDTTTTVPPVASTNLPEPSTSTGLPSPSPIISPTAMSPSNLWAIVFAPLGVLLLVLIIVAVVAILYYKRRRRNLNLKPGPSKGSLEDDSGIERETIIAGDLTLRIRNAHPLASHRPSVQLRRMLPHRMIIPSSVLKLQDSIGQGEFGVVYKGRLQWHLDAATEVVAVKTLKGLFTPNDVDSLVQEVLKMHTLSHPNVMPLTGVCLDSGGGPAVVMPFMGNGSVLNYLKKERGKLVPPNDADCSVITDVQTHLLGMCLQISKGMEYLAKQKILHRDLAARNCMMDAHGVIKVADFGLSEDIYTSTYYRQEKSDTAVKLPVRWMAPESTADGIFTEKSDVWSFGVTCWEVFTGGHIPYGGIGPMALLQLLRNGERLNKPVNPSCSDEIYAILRDCWKEEPKERPEFSKLVVTFSHTLEAAAGYMDFSLSIKDERPVAADVKAKTREGGSSVQAPSEKEEGGQRETVV